jgi:hypothetical protein
MQRTLILSVLAAASAFAQSEGNHVFVTGGVFGFQQRMSSAAVQGAPYSATITNESVQTLADGNRIVQSSTGNTARDSLGRTRQDAPLPPIGNMSPADEPHLVFIQDPVAQTSYTLNLADKTVFKGPNVMFGPGTSFATTAAIGSVGPGVRIRGATSSITAVHAQPQMITIQKNMITDEQPGQVQTEDLGAKTMEGVTAMGTRTTSTIPAGQIGNDKPLSIVTEVWTSPELKTVVYSKRSDPRMGDQTFKLTNIVRAEPDPSLFMVPSEFKIISEGAEPILYKASPSTSTEPQP